MSLDSFPFKFDGFDYFKGEIYIKMQLQLSDGTVESTMFPANYKESELHSIP